ncbi:surp module domain-containing protein [Ditylenchus destructor]|uniref:Surp module domain-containing protein n=1 Tax=Ditylenchus destructor TaxID=166010 RepID=A0AAD4MLJ5_9BILA|nr:surp module domain-containing protein [Ditylenchus destructor]
MEKLLKKKKDEEEQLRLQEALHEYNKEFEDTPGAHVPKAFMRGEIVNASKSVSATPSVYKPAPVQTVKPKLPPPSLEQAKRLAEQTAKKIMQEASLKSQSKIPANRPPKPGTKKVVQSSKMTNLEMFKEELKQVQAMRDQRKGLRQQLEEKLGPNSEVIDRIAPPMDNPFLIGSLSEFDDDPTTTNLYVCNMPIDIQMEELYQTFGTFGPLASAKILYPRNDEERKRDHLCGFIAFISRVDAERARCVMSGEKIRGCELRVSWARPVAIPPVPFYVPIPLRELAIPDPPSGLPFNAKPLTSDLREFLRKWGDLPRLGAVLPTDKPQMVKDYKKMISNSVVRVVQVSDRNLLMLIHRVIEFLIREGPLMEAIIMARERANPMYRFLFENHHPAHVYYRWKLYSVLQGEDRMKWRLERFRMFQDGSWWEPPPHSLWDGMPPQLYSTSYMPQKKARILEERPPPPSHRKRTYSSGSDEEEGKPEQPQPRKYKGVLDEKEREELEDILRNMEPTKTSIGDAMVWCVEHAECAKEIVHCIYESLCIRETPLNKKIARMYLTSDILANCGARLRDVFYFRQFFGDVLLKIFTALNETLEGIESRLKAEQFRSRVMLCFRMWEDNSLYPVDMLINMQNVFLGLTKVAEPESYANEGMDVDVDGEPLLDEVEDIDGVPLEEDIDGEPLDSADDEAKPNLEPMFKTSSWNQVETETEPIISGSKWDNNEQQSMHQSALESSPDRPEEYDEERRKMLREIEVKVVKLQDELEAENAPDIENEIAKYRKKLTDKMEEKLAKLAGKRNSKEKDGHKKDRDSERRSRDKERDKGHSSRERSESKTDHSARSGRSDRDYEQEKDHRSESERERDKTSTSSNGRDRDRDRSYRDDRDRERRSERSPEKRRR